MAQALSKDLTLKQLRERRERLVRELASLEPSGALSAREVLTWRTRLAELDSRIAHYQRP